MHDEKNIDRDIEHIVDILQNVPQEEIPEHFEMRLKNAIRDEAKRIRESEGLNIKKQNKKRYMKIAATIAACFVVGFITVTMYNYDMELPYQDDASGELSITSMESAEQGGEENARLYIDNGEYDINDTVKRELQLAPYDITDEYIEYERLIELYLGEAEYQILSYYKEEDTEEYVFNILITKDSEGNTVTTRMVLKGSEGEIYEPQQDKGEPISCY
ncbi:MAG: hypothetical protein GX076_09275 [Clostridiales bacterium]|nr:hypothetical protein [Clostridiales bacterium]